MSKLKTRLTAVARGGLLLALVALGVALVFSAWTSRHDVERISALLDRGQSDRFFHSVPQIHERNHGPATTQDLQQLLSQFREEGLRYLAEYDSDGQLLAEAGVHHGVKRPRPGGIGTHQQPQLIGDRVRVSFHPPRAADPRHNPPGPGQPPPGSPPGQPFANAPLPGPGPGAEPHPPGAPSWHETERGFRLPDLVIEFEPTVANQLRSRANKSFVFSTAAAIALFALTLGLWLALKREERHRSRSERERQLASLGEMSAVLAHEIRNPLASLKGHAQLLGEQLGDDSRAQKKVERIVSEAKRLEELTSTLLDLVRSSSVTRQPADPAQLLRDAADSIDPARIQLDTTSAPSSWPLDALRIEQVLKNLLQNAVQASPEAQPIEARATLERGKLVVAVRDHGEGLPEGKEGQIFDAFHTTRVKGTGLGLAVARRIVELHGGQLRGENHPEGGAVFTLSIPD